MARVTPDQYAEKWGRRTSGAVQDYVQGVRAVQQAPGQQAAAKVNEYVQGVQANAQIWARNVGSVSLSEWQQKTADLGAARIASGVQAATPKMQRVAASLLPAVDAAAAAAKSLPGGSTEQRIQRAVRFMNEMHQFKMRGTR